MTNLTFLAAHSKNIRELNQIEKPERTCNSISVPTDFLRMTFVIFQFHIIDSEPEGQK